MHAIESASELSLLHARGMHALRHCSRLHTCCPASRRALAAGALHGADSSTKFPFPMRITDVRIDGERSVRLTLPADEVAVLDYYIARNEGDADPFWSALWPSSIALAGQLLRAPQRVRGKRVIDVGCGLGLAGLAAALAGAADVCLADREPLAMQCSLLSAELSGLFPTPLGEDSSAQRSAELRAQLEQTFGASAAGLGAVRALLLDWHAAPASLDGAFDVMLAADVLYDKTSAEPVAALARRLLAPGGLLLLADPPARTPAHRARMIAALGPGMRQLSDEMDSVMPEDSAVAVPIQLCSFEVQQLQD